MAALITQADLEAYFGTHNVRKWSNLDNDDTAVNEERVATSIAVAHQMVEDALRDSRYALPLSGNSSGALAILETVEKRLAGWDLYTSRGIDEAEGTGSQLQKVAEHALKLLRMYRTGELKLDAAQKHSTPTGMVVV